MREVDLRGQVVADRYEVEARLGSGGMGSVWRVRHTESLQQLALKVLHPTLAEDPRATVRLLREARATAALHSRHVVRVVDSRVGHRQGGRRMPFLVMELLVGSTLEELTRRTALSPGQTVWVFSQLSRALAQAHERGIVHRDLKPSNVFVALDEEGQPLVKLCDFGMAKLPSTGDGSVSHTRSGELLGTPLYMSPEQLRDAKHVGPEADQWALGLLAFRLLTGRDFFASAASAADLVVAVLSERLEIPSHLSERLGPSFDAWFFRSCAPAPDDRFGSVEEQTAALRVALANPDPAQVLPALPRERAPSGPERVLSNEPPSWFVVPGSSLVMGVTVLSMGAMWWSGRALSARDIEMEEREFRRVPSSGSELAPVPSPAPSTASPGEPAVESPPTVTIATGAIVQPIPSVFEPKPRSGSVVRRERPAPEGQPAPVPPPSTSEEPQLLPSGAMCGRSSECRSGLCFGEVCR